MDKATLRKWMINKLKQMNPVEKSSIEQKLTTHLFEMAIWKNAAMIGLTVSQHFEWDTEPIINRAWQEDKIVVIPKCNTKTKKMIFYKIKSMNDVKLGYANIMEPKISVAEKMEKQSIDLLIVPGLLFDEFGFRIGFGGGYYDRFLSNFNPTTVSLVSKLQLVEKLPVDKYDIPIQFIVTEDGFKQVKK